MKLPWKLPPALDRFKYPALILLLGLALLLWPGRKENAPERLPSETAETLPAEREAEAYRSGMERQLETVLSQIDGAGRVRVMLSLKNGAETRYQTDALQSERREGEEVSLSREEKTVMLSRGSAYNEPVVVTKLCPAFQGALIVAEGGGDPRVRLSISGAVAALLGLGADQITVLKMK